MYAYVFTKILDKSKAGLAEFLLKNGVNANIIVKKKIKN